MMSIPVMDQVFDDVYTLYSVKDQVFDDVYTCDGPGV